MWLTASAVTCTTRTQDGDGTISRDEFTSALAGEPVLYDVFAGRSMPALEPIKEPFNEFLEAHEVGIDHLVQVWEDTSSIVVAGTRQRDMTLVQFRKFMQDHFFCTAEDMPLVNRLFLALDYDNSGSLDYQELFYGLSCVTHASKAEKAGFYFSLYDTDGSGEMDKDEVGRQARQPGLVLYT